MKCTIVRIFELIMQCQIKYIQKRHTIILNKVYDDNNKYIWQLVVSIAFSKFIHFN